MPTVCVINVDGADVSSNILPSLIKVTICEKSGKSADSCDITLDDTGGRILLPRDGAMVEVLLGNESGVDLAFTGTVDDVKSTLSRSGGRTLSISAKGVDTRGKAKQPMQKHWDKKPLSSVMTDAAQAAGIGEMIVAPGLSSITRDYVAMQAESFLHFGERIAREVGGTFKVAGQRAILADRNSGMSASGKPLLPVDAAVGVNLIEATISPFQGRPRHVKARVRHYDRAKAQWMEQSEDITDTSATAEHLFQHVAADEGEAKSRAASHKKDALRKKGEGSLTILGSTTPQPECTVNISGMRPGIDGTYVADSVTQEYSRSGWTTRIEVRKPGGSAGVDGR